MTTPTVPASAGAPATPPTATSPAGAAAPAEAGTHSIPSIADTAQQLATVNGRLEAMCNTLAAELPENLRALIPTGLPPTDRLEWLTKAKSAGPLGGSVQVPETDIGKPKVTPKDVDLSQLPPMARLAAGYTKKA